MNIYQKNGWQGKRWEKNDSFDTMIVCLYSKEDISLRSLGKLSGMSYEGVRNILQKRMIARKSRGGVYQGKKKRVTLVGNKIPLNFKRQVSHSVHREIKKGHLEKPDYCEICLKEDLNKRLEAHHDDYRKPFDVVWSCTTCHKMLHRILKRYPFLCGEGFFMSEAPNSMEKDKILLSTGRTKIWEKGQDGKRLYRYLTKDGSGFILKNETNIIKKRGRGKNRMTGTTVRKRFWETNKAEYAANAYRFGATLKSLAERYGVPMSAISQTLKVYAVATRPRGRKAQGWVSR